MLGAAVVPEVGVRPDLAGIDASPQRDPEQLAPRLDESDQWEQSLPLRAQQRLGVARAVLHRPAWLFMEQATDAFDPQAEGQLLEMLRRELPRSTLLTVSFHPGLEPLHDRTLHLGALRETRFLFESRRRNGVAAH